MNELMMGVRKLIKTERTLMAVDADIFRCIADNLDPYMLAEDWRNPVKVWSYRVDKEGRKTVLFPPYHPETVELDKYAHETLFLETALILHDYSPYVFVSKKG